MTEDEMVGWHHQLKGHEFEHTLGDSEGQGSLACCSPRGRKESDTAEGLNNNKRNKGDVPGGPVVKTSPSNAGGADSTRDQGAKTPHASGPRNHNLAAIL